MKIIIDNFSRIQLFIFLMLLPALFSCNNSDKTYKIAISDPSTSLNQVGIPLVKLLEKELNIKFEIVDQTSGSSEHIKLLSTITPLYNQNLFIIYPDSLKPKNIGDLIRGRRIGLGVEEGGTAMFTQNIFKELGIDYSEYTAVYGKNKDNVCNNSIDVSCSFTSFNSNRIVNMLKNKNTRLFSLDDAEKAFGGSAVDGICKKLWTAKPLVIPKNSYYSKPEEPILTVSVFTSLLCKKNLDTEFIHDITETIVKNKSILIKENPVINQVSENNLHETLYYPLHRGVHMFLDRNKPSFLERYAEVIALVLSIVILLSGIISSYRNWSKQRKKDRIDVYYEQVLEIDCSIMETTDTQKLNQKIETLYKIRERAFENLIKEKLSADESFKIFMNLMTDAIHKIEQRL